MGHDSQVALCYFGTTGNTGFIMHNGTRQLGDVVLLRGTTGITGR